MTTDRPPRCRPLPPEIVAAVAEAPHDTPEAVLLQRLEEALAALPAAERSALVTAYGYDEGLAGVAVEQGLSRAEADSLTRSALQLIRAALASAEEAAAPLDHPTSARNAHRAGSTGRPGRGGASYQG